MTSLQLAWIAGLLEGEGSFTYRDKEVRRHPRIGFDSTDRDVAERFAALFNLHVCVRAPNMTTHRKPVYIIRFGGVRAVGLMMSIYSLMGLRRKEQIRECLRLWRTRVNSPKGWAAHRALYGCQCHTKSRRGCPVLLADNAVGV